MPSFDIVSELNLQEVDNAINQARKEIEGRFDFKGSHCEIQWDKKLITLIGDDEHRMEAMLSVIQSKLIRRGVDIKALKVEKQEPAGGKLIRQKLNLIQGIEKDKAKDLTKIIKDSKLKVQTQIVDDKLRVTSKSIDELQETMKLVKSTPFEVPLQFDNMRS